MTFSSFDDVIVDVIPRDHVVTPPLAPRQRTYGRTIGFVQENKEKFISQEGIDQNRPNLDKVVFGVR